MATSYGEDITDGSTGRRITSGVLAGGERKRKLERIQNETGGQGTITFWGCPFLQLLLVT
jgi:hypothetical protein